MLDFGVNCQTSKNFCEILCKNLDPIASVTKLFSQLIVKPLKFSVKFSAKVKIQKNFWELDSRDPILFPPLIHTAYTYKSACLLTLSRDNFVLLSKCPLGVQHNNSGCCLAQFFLLALAKTVFFTFSIKFIAKKGKILGSCAGQITYVTGK